MKICLLGFDNLAVLSPEHREHYVGGESVQQTLLARALSAREKEILRWIHLGKSNFEIGTILSISPLTVKNHVQKILRKLNVRNRTHAVGRALQLRILDI